MTDDVYATISPPDRPRAERRPSRLLAWLILVAVMAALSFASNAAVADQTSQTSQTSQPSIGIYTSTDPQQPPTIYGLPAAAHDDSFYRYTTGVGGLVQYGILLLVVLVIAGGLPRKEVFALYRPKSWPRALGLVLGVLAATYVVLALASAALGGGGKPDQGIPVFWDESRAAQFALSFLVVAVVAPIVEELTFRGLGFGLLSKYGVLVALVGTAVLFGLVHGFLVALPLFVIVGLALGWLRMRSGSVYPGMVMHGLFNAAVTVAAISLG